MFGSANYVNVDMESIGLGSVQIRNAFEGEQRLGYAYGLFAQIGVSWTMGVLCGCAFISSMLRPENTFIFISVRGHDSGSLVD
jgi:hypothetical protein